MTDLAITATGVVAGANSTQSDGILGETVTAGQAIYKQLATSKWFKADSNATTPAEAKTPGGIALNGGAVNQPVRVHKSGDITLPGAAMAPGAAFYLSDTAGGICPFADVGSGETVAQIGIAKSATVLAVDIQLPGVTL